MIIKAFSLFAMLAYISSCGQEFNQEQNLERGLNKLKSLEVDETLSSGEKSLMRSFCAKLDDKVLLFNSSYVGETSIKLDMSVSDTGCGEDPVESLATPNVKDVGNKLYYSSGVPFAEVITKDSNELADFCEKSLLEDDVLNYRVTGGEVRWYELMKNSDKECGIDAKDENTVCLKISTGIKATEDDFYKVIKIDFLKTTLASNGFGGVIYSRHSVDSQVCDESKFSIKVQKINALVKATTTP